MAAGKPEVLITRKVVEVFDKLQRLHPSFRGCGHFKFLALTMTSIDVDGMCTGLKMLENIGVCIGILKTGQSSTYIQVISAFSM